MANIKSAKKKARKDIVRHEVNLARKTSIKTALKKVLTALDEGVAAQTAVDLMRDAEAKLARAKSKGTIHPNTAARKISRLAKRVAAAKRAQA